MTNRPISEKTFTLRLPRRLWLFLMAQAKRRRLSMAAIVREAITEKRERENDASDS